MFLKGFSNDPEPKSSKNFLFCDLFKKMSRQINQPQIVLLILLSGEFGNEKQTTSFYVKAEWWLGKSTSILDEYWLLKS